MCHNIICCAPTENGRCTQQTLNENCDHCSAHHDIALKLYLEYKEICAIANSKNIDIKISDPQKQIKYLFNCHTWFVRAYNARLKHRFYAYVPETYDNGHNKQFQIIQDKINICQNKISELNTLQISPETNNKEDFEEEENNNKEDFEEENNNKEDFEEEFNDEKEIDTKLMITRINNFKKKQIENDRAFDKILRKNIAENDRILKERIKIGNLILRLIESHTDNKYNIFFVQISIFRIFVEMYNLDYFEPEYYPKACENCNCGGYKPDYFSLGCPCYLRTDITSLNFLLEIQATNKQLKIIYHAMLTNMPWFIPIIEDFILLYKKHNTGLIKNGMAFMWDSEEDRPILHYNTISSVNRRSQEMKQFRHNKTKILQKHLKNKIEKQRYVPTEQEKWKQTLHELCNYIDRNDKLPSSKSKQPKIQSLNTWLTKQIQNYTENRDLTSEHQLGFSFHKFLHKYNKFFDKKLFPCIEDPIF